MARKGHGSVHALVGGRSDATHFGGAEEPGKCWGFRALRRRAGLSQEKKEGEKGKKKRTSPL